MPFVAAPNVVQIEWRYVFEGQHCENRLMIDNLAPLTGSTLEELAVFAWNWWENTYSVDISDAVHLSEVVATDMGEQNGGQFVYAPDTTTDGQHGGGAMPNETSFCISLHSASRGRSARGRWFVAGVGNDQRNGVNEVGASTAENWRASLQTYIDAIAGTTRLVVIVSRFNNGAPRVGGPVYFPVISATITDLILDSQRRRKPGVGA
jgi:hypothetical protein